jgi:hypothetical protein
MRWSALQLSGMFFSLTIAIISGSCDKRDQMKQQTAAEYNQRLRGMAKSGIVAGPGEKTFEESQGVKVSLPIPEDNFLALLNRLKLPFEVIGERGTNAIVPHPWHSDTLDISKIQRAYQIYGKIDRAHQSREMYRAYIDRGGRVVYIENMFGYSGP